MVHIEYLVPPKTKLVAIDRLAYMELNQAEIDANTSVPRQQGPLWTPLEIHITEVGFAPA